VSEKNEVQTYNNNDLAHANYL